MEAPIAVRAVYLTHISSVGLRSSTGQALAGLPLTIVPNLPRHRGNRRQRVPFKAVVPVGVRPLLGSAIPSPICSPNARMSASELKASVIPCLLNVVTRSGRRDSGGLFGEAIHVRSPISTISVRGGRTSVENCRWNSSRSQTMRRP